MANKYCTATYTGKGFYTHKDREDFYLSGHGAVWVVGDNIEGQNRGPSYNKAMAWINRVNGTYITKAEAQVIVDAEMEVGQAHWDNLPADSLEKEFNRPEKYTLP